MIQSKMVRLDETVWRKIKSLAALEGVSMAQMIQTAMQEKIDRTEKQARK